MSKNQTNVGTIVEENKTETKETAEQRAERQTRESAIIRLAASRVSQFIIGDTANEYPIPVSKVKGLLTMLVGESLHDDGIKPKQQTAGMKLAYLLGLSDDDFQAVCDALKQARDDFRTLDANKTTIDGGIQSHVFAAQVAGSFMPDSSAASALAYKTAAVKSMVALGFVKDKPE